MISPTRTPCSADAAEREPATSYARGACAACCGARVWDSDEEAACEKHSLLFCAHSATPSNEETTR